jgi:hypothetical protein
MLTVHRGSPTEPCKVKVFCPVQDNKGNVRGIKLSSEVAVPPHVHPGSAMRLASGGIVVSEHDRRNPSRSRVAVHRPSGVQWDFQTRYCQMLLLAILLCTLGKQIHQPIKDAHAPCARTTLICSACVIDLPCHERMHGGHASKNRQVTLTLTSRCCNDCDLHCCGCD